MITHPTYPLRGQIRLTTSRAGVAGVYSRLLPLGAAPKDALVLRSISAVLNPSCIHSNRILLTRGPLCSFKGQPISWSPVGKTALTLVKQQPINFGSRGSTAYIKLSTDDSGGGLTNTGYWGIPVQKGRAYQLAVIIRSDYDGDISNEVRSVMCCCS